MPLEPGELYELHLEDSRIEDLSEPVLVHALAGFVDAGSAGKLAVDAILESLEHFTLATFDADQLVDYRSRRPLMTFEQDRFTAFEAPELKVVQVIDRAGTPFLLLTGFEPDFGWEGFVAAVGHIADRFGVRLTVGLNAIPMGVPHTRPTGLTSHANRDGLLTTAPFWNGSMQVPGHIGGLIEFRFGEAGRDAIGFAAHVPHYLARAEFPEASRELLQAASEAGGLDLPTERLTELAQANRVAIDEQVSGSEEVANVVQALEQQYDTFISARGKGLLADNAPLPTADELGAEFEAFLAGRSTVEE
ncbi:PAC2 family protein [Nakamurella antarctica]|uniref:PAC2 family protein n=1 Tax=Nakamurella antarctica TaxID=1902245 RepID=A0A3G8ZP03_9ACTN|nr:PAC2 family protein [Nakamurella antarctica]AZI59029.1 PAC2 family protein [Nakamurella antarctica]